MADQSVEKFIEYSQLYRKEMDELTKRKIKQILEQQFTLGTLGNFNLSLKEIIETNKEKIKEQTAKEHNNGWLFITVSPKPTIKFRDFERKITKLVNRKMFTNVEYAYEQRSSDPTKFHGYHVHILAKRNLLYKPFNCKKNIKNTCKDLVGNLHSNQQLNIQVIGEDFASDKREYFTGVKTGEGKEQKQVVDKIWRDSLDIKPVYFISNIAKS